MNFKKLYFLSSLFLLTSMQNYGMYKPKQRPINRNDILQLVKSIIFFPDSCSVIFHELGHALVAKFLNNSPIDIHIGTDIYKQLDYLLKCRVLTAHSFNLSSGAYAQTFKQASITRNILVTLGGPIFGIITLLLLKKIINKLYNKYNQNKYIKYSCAWYNNMCNSYIIFQVLNGFAPVLGNTSDGYNIWKDLGVSEKQLNQFCMDNNLLSVMIGIIPAINMAKDCLL